MPGVLIAGCGFVGEAAAALLREGGWEVTGVTHSLESAERISAGGLRCVACDISDADAVRAHLGEFEGIDAIVDCVSAGRGGGAEEYRRAYLEGATNLIDALHPERFLFTSSTSVYAQIDGSWVTEQSPAEPPLETGRILRETEELVLQRAGSVLRLAGIYGPGRWALLKKFLGGEAVIEGDGGRWTNSIHREDAAGAIAFVLSYAVAPGIYNAADNTPLTQIDCYRILSRLLEKPMPPHGPLDTGRKRGVTSKRVSNGKLRGLGWAPRYVSIEAALGDEGSI